MSSLRWRRAFQDPSPLNSECAIAHMRVSTMRILFLFLLRCKLHTLTASPQGVMTDLPCFSLTSQRPRIALSPQVRQTHIPFPCGFSACCVCQILWLCGFPGFPAETASLVNFFCLFSGDVARRRPTLRTPVTTAVLNFLRLTSCPRHVPFGGCSNVDNMISLRVSHSLLLQECFVLLEGGDERKKFPRRKSDCFGIEEQA